MNRHIIIGTAGHIDHGKTTLIKALTGRQTDTLEEEQKRGITINLGFTYFDLPNGKRVGVIDVPGHEKFIKNMMAGCIGIDIVLLTVAADDGVMPQTIEHADILHFMGVEKAIIVITKIDNVDKEMVDLVEEDIRLSFKDTLLANCPIVRVDSISRKGLDTLISKIEEISDKIEDKKDSKDTRMNIDRVFSLKGFGTIVTGTLIEGEILKDRDYMIYPYEKYTHIRRIENHGLSEQKALKGQRTSLNLTNFHKDELKRGDILASPNSLIKGKNIQARLYLTRHCKKELKHFDRVRFFLGTREVLARIIPLTSSKINKDQAEIVEFRLEEEIYLKNMDRFVIRNYSPVYTLGGGRVIDINNENHTINSKDYIEYLRAKENFSKDMILIDFLNNFKSFDNTYTYMGDDKIFLKKIITKLIKSEKIIKINDFLISKDSLNRKIQSLEKILKTYHRNFPLEEGMNKNEFSKYIPELDKKSLEDFLNNPITKKYIEISNDKVRNTNFRVNTKNKEKDIRKILTLIENEEPELLKYKDLARNKEEQKILSYLLKSKITKLDNYLIRNVHLERLKKDILEFTKDKSEFKLAEFRDLSKMSRKMTQEVLEYWDKINFTKRIGDVRIIKKK